jgi:hypothetical protein
MVYVNNFTHVLLPSSYAPTTYATDGNVVAYLMVRFFLFHFLFLSAPFILQFSSYILFQENELQDYSLHKLMKSLVGHPAPGFSRMHDRWGLRLFDWFE